MKAKILIVASVFPPDAVTSAYLNYDLAEGLSKDFDVTVIRPYPSRPKGMKDLLSEEEVSKNYICKFWPSMQ